MKKLSPFIVIEINVSKELCFFKNTFEISDVKSDNKIFAVEFVETFENYDNFLYVKCYSFYMYD